MSPHLFRLGLPILLGLALLSLGGCCVAEALLFDGCHHHHHHCHDYHYRGCHLDQPEPGAP